jgi:hypothetical protein
MFPGYLFIHHGMEKKSYIEILNARGVVRSPRRRLEPADADR